MTRITQQQLESYLWGAAVLLRGTIDAGDYKQFIFPLLFYKRLCDVFDEETQTALRESEGDLLFALFPENHRFQIPADAHWREIRKVSRDVGRGLQQAMRAIETANPDKLFGIFGDAQWTNKDRLSDAMLRDLIEHFSSLELTVANLPEDELGQGYEPSGARSTAAGCPKGGHGGAHQYLIKKFADDSGHTAAEPERSGDSQPQAARRANEVRQFYTNRTVVHLMTEMLDVQPGESVYDPTCGSGGMLTEAMETCVVVCRTQKPKARRGKILFINAVNEVTRERAQSFLTDEHLQRVVRAYQDFKDEPGFTRVVPIEEIRAKEGNLSIPLYVGGETQAQTDAAVETATTALTDALAAWLQSSATVRLSLKSLLSAK